MPGYELLGTEELQEVKDLFENGAVLLRHGFAQRRNGKYFVRQFEDEFADYVGCAGALAVSCATAGIEIALRALGVGEGDEVITQAFTYIATAEAILHVGAVPVIANIDDSLNMDPEDLRRKITLRTKAVVPVHMLGVPANLDSIRDIAAEHGLTIVEDAAEALGALWRGRPVGGYSDVGVHSFDYNKTITSGEGGMLTTDRLDVLKRATEYHDHGHQNLPNVPRGQDPWACVGFNYRMSELSAAVGVAQFRKLGDIKRINEKRYAEFAAALDSVAGLKFRAIPEECEPLYDTLIVMLPSKASAHDMAGRMAQTGIPTKNLPDAMSWHFAGDWTHVFDRYGVSARELDEATARSRDLLDRSVAIPILVAQEDEEAARWSDGLVRAATDALRA